MKLVKFLTVICALVLLPTSWSNTLEECIGQVPNSKRKQSKMLTLFSGEPGFEVFNAINTNDVKYINLLASCAQKTMGVEPVVQKSSRGLTAVSNITDLTSIFATSLPSIYKTISNGIEYGFVKNKSRFRRKKTSFNGLTMKSVFHLHTDIGNMHLLRERLTEIKDAENARKSVFIVHNKESLDQVNAANEKMLEPETDKHMEEYMTVEPSDVRYYVVIPLNERSEFSGGEMLVRKAPNKEHYSHRSSQSQATATKKATEDDPDEEEEQEESDVEAEREEQEEQMQLRSIQEEKRPKFDRFTRFTPDKGSILVLNGAHDVGIRPITHGERKALVIEYVEETSAKSDL